MESYLLVGSRDPFESTEARRLYELAGALADNGAEVSVFLVQNGVLGTRTGTSAAATVSGLGSRATVVADAFSLRERAIYPSELAEGVTMGGMDSLVENLMADGRKALWL